MITGNTSANSEIMWISKSGDTGRRGAEHRDFLKLWFAHNSARNRSEAYIHFTPLSNGNTI
jgi:hypothetical protein